MAVVLTSVTIGRLSGFAPESGKARLAAARILELINRVPAVDPRNDVGIKPVSGLLRCYSVITINVESLAGLTSHCIH